MGERRPTRSFVLAPLIAAAVVLLLVLAALGARGIPGTSRAASLAVTLDVLNGLRIAGGLLAVAAIVWLALRARRGVTPSRGEPTGRNHWLPLLIVLAFILLLAYLVPRNLERDEAGQQVLVPDPDSEVYEPLPVEDLGSGWVVVALGALVALTAVGFALIARRGGERTETVEDGVAAAFTTAISKLEWSYDPRSVIIKAYVDIERSLAEQGVPRAASEAPREYVTRVLTQLNVRPATIERLTLLFEEARFSTHDLDSLDAREAVDVMTAVRSDLVAVRS